MGRNLQVPMTQPHGGGVDMVLEERETEEGLVDEITEEEIRGAIARLRQSCWSVWYTGQNGEGRR